MKQLILAATFALVACALPIVASAAPPPALPPAQRSFDSGSIHADVYGTPGKPALILIPGFTCGPWVWGNEVKLFAPNYTIYALTLPGFDGRPNAATPLFATVSSDFWSMLQSRQIAKPVLIGHSLGGTLALLLAAQHSELLRGAVAVDGLPVFPGFQNASPSAREAQAKALSAQMATATPTQFIAFERSFSLPTLVTAPADAASIADNSAGVLPATAAQWYSEFLTTDLRPMLKNAAVPLLEVAPYDQSFDSKPPVSLPSAAAKQTYYAGLLANAPNAKVVVVSPSRHFVMYDQPAQLDAAITSFLQALP